MLPLVAAVALAVHPTPGPGPGLEDAVRMRSTVTWNAVATWNATVQWDLELQKRPAQRPVSVSVAKGGTNHPTTQAGPTSWDGVAACESGNDWSINTGSGYYGGLQENMAFWTAHGGLAYAARPDLATKDQQITVAERAGSRAPWPVCGSR